MFRVTVIQTFDGVQHPNESAALNHLHVLHADLLGRLSRECCACEAKYIRTGDWIDANLQRFADLQRIKDDMQLVSEEP